MADISSQPRVVRFDEIEIDLQAGRLFRPGVKVKLRKQLVVVLSAVLEHADEVVTREEFQRRVWPGNVVVDFDISLNTIIARLREALGDSTEHPRYIETVPKRGYRFPADLSGSASSESALPRRIRLIVLPFSNVDGDPAEEYVGMSDTLLSCPPLIDI